MRCCRFAGVAQTASILNGHSHGVARSSACLVLRRAQTTSAAAPADASAPKTAADVGASATAESRKETAEQSAAKRQAARDSLIAEILARDKEIFEIKRQHELSMLRVEQNQKRTLKDQEDRGMYYEQNANVVTFDTISVGLYSQRSTFYHTRGVERLRNFKLLLMVLCTIATCAYLYYRYMINADFTYIGRPMKLVGSQVLAMRELNWDGMSEAEKIETLKKQDALYRQQEAHQQQSTQKPAAPVSK